MKYKIILEGMHCDHCQENVKKRFNQINSVKVLEVNAGKGYAIVESEKPINDTKIKKALEQTDYKLIEIKEHRKENGKVLDFLFMAVFFLIFFNLTKIYTPTFEEGATITLGLVFMFGLLNSLHCMGMCGSFLVSYLISSDDKKNTGVYSYLIGKLISYTLIGGLFGAFGSLFVISDAFKAGVMLVGSLVMILMAFKMIGWIKLPTFNLFKNKIKPGKSMFMVGLLNGLMPCGPLQIMQIYALASGSFLSGAIILFTFGAATSISLLILGLTSNKISFFKSPNFKYVGFLVIAAISFNMFTSGMNQLQTSGASSTEVITNQNGSPELSLIEDLSVDYQEITMTTDGGYSFDKEAIDSSKPVKIIFNNQGLDGCNNPVTFITPSGAKLKVNLKDNDYIIFNPNEKGKLQVICWMGMRSSRIAIV